jgi:membrane associated rhomboid family serine protease
VFILPYGHDQSVYGRQWVTWGLIAVNVLAFGASWLASLPARDELGEAITELATERVRHPDARVDPAVLRSSPEIAEELSFLSQREEDAPLTDEDLELEVKTRRTIEALHALPSYRFGYQPGAPSPLAFFTSMFMHADIWHLLGNLLFLWLAGAVIECFWDRIPYAILYLGAGAGATLAHQLAFPESFVPLVGASGAISGLLGAFVVGYPRTRIRMLYFVPVVGIGHVYVRAWLLIPGWLLLQIAFALIDRESVVAHWAHIGGFVVGVASALFMKRMGWVIQDASPRDPS